MTTGEPVPKNDPNDTEERMAVDDMVPFVLPSIERAIHRFTAIDGRIQNLITLLAAVTSTAPVAGRAVVPSICFNPIGCWQALPFIFAITIGVVGIVWGARKQTRGSMQMLRLEQMYDTHHNKTSKQFQDDVVRAAGKTELVNRCRLDKRAIVAERLSVALAVEILLVVVWIAVAAV